MRRFFETWAWNRFECQCLSSWFRSKDEPLVAEALTEGAWCQCTKPKGDGLRRDCSQILLTQKPLERRGKEGRSWTRVAMKSSPQAGSHRVFYLLLYTLTSRQKSISFMSKMTKNRFWVNNVPKYQSCDYIQAPGKSVGFKESTVALMQDNGLEMLHWV